MLYTGPVDALADRQARTFQAFYDLPLAQQRDRD